VPAVDRQLKDRDTFLAEIKERLLHAQDLMKHSYDANHRDISFEVGDWAWLRLHQRVAAAIKDRSGGKLAPRFYGPFRVEAKVGPVAYRLALPPRAHIHNVFHVGFLKKFVGDPPSAMVPLPPIHHGRVLPTPASVDKARMVRGVWQVRVQWVGQPASDATWEPVPDFTEAYPAGLPARGRAVSEGGGKCYGRLRGPNISAATSQDEEGARAGVVSRDSGSGLIGYRRRQQGLRISRISLLQFVRVGCRVWQHISQTV